MYECKYDIEKGSQENKAANNIILARFIPRILTQPGIIAIEFHFGTQYQL